MRRFMVYRRDGAILGAILGAIPGKWLRSSRDHPDYSPFGFSPSVCNTCVSTLRYCFSIIKLRSPTISNQMDDPALGDHYMIHLTNGESNTMSHIVWDTHNLPMARLAIRNECTLVRCFRLICSRQKITTRLPSNDVMPDRKSNGRF